MKSGIVRIGGKSNFFTFFTVLLIGLQGFGQVAAPKPSGVREVRPTSAMGANSNVCDVRGFGAKGDGTHNDTAAIQRAIEACAAQGGGNVLFPKGTYLSGSIRLESNITLLLEQGADLLGSSDVGLYTPVGRSAENRTTSLIWAIGVRNIGITGPGLIDGNGRAFMSTQEPHSGLPFYDPRRTRQGA